MNMRRLCRMNFGDAFNGGMIDGTCVQQFVHQQHELLYTICKFGSLII
jgi:hypothetical protein